MKGTIYIDDVAIGVGEIFFTEINYDDRDEKISKVNNKSSDFFKSVRLNGKEVIKSH